MRTKPFSFLRKQALAQEDETLPFVFLGGTCNETTWREQLISELTISYFNPVVVDWTPECQEAENQAKETAAVSLYVITPKHTGFFSIAEMTHAAFNSSGHKVVICFLDEDAGVSFDNRQIDSNKAIEALVGQGENCVLLHSLEEVAAYLNKLPELQV